MTPRTRPPSAWVPYLLMSGILAFGIGAATLVLLSDDPSSEPSPVAIARGEQRDAPESPDEAAPVPASPASAPAPVAAPVPSTTVVGKTATTKPSAAPTAASAVTQPATARAPATPAPRPAPVAAAVAARPAATSEAAPKPIPVKRRPAAEPAPEPEVAFTKTPPKVEGKVVLKSEDPAPTPAPAARSAPAATPAETKSAGIDTKPAGEVEPVKPTGKSVHATPLVAPPPAKPTVVMATGEKAWVKLDDQRTVIVPKGQEVPGLGVFHGTEGRGAKFDSGVQPVTP